MKFQYLSKQRIKGGIYTYEHMIMMMKYRHKSLIMCMQLTEKIILQVKTVDILTRYTAEAIIMDGQYCSQNMKEMLYLPVTCVSNRHTS